MTLRRLAILLAAGVSSVAAQAVPKWEAVSIRPCVDGGGSGPQGPGRITFSCTSVNTLVMQAFLMMADGKMDLSRMQTPVVGSPRWMLVDRFTVEAKAEVAPGKAPPGRGIMMGPMLQALLADRFELKIHTEDRQGPVYALTVAKAAPGLQRTVAGSCAPSGVDGPAPTGPPLPPCAFPPRDASGFHGTTMKQFAAFLSQRTDRRVIDRTGLMGTFDIHIDWFNGNAPGGPGQPPLPPPPPSSTEREDQTAAIRDSLRKIGLQLEATEGAAEILVIDHVENPSQN